MEAKKGRGIEEVLQSLSPSQIEEIKVPETASSALTQALHHYDEALQKSGENQAEFWRSSGSWAKPFYCENMPVLTPQEIDVFLRVLSVREYPGSSLPLFADLTISGITSRFLQYLIQTSFERGYNNFILHGDNVYHKALHGKIVLPDSVVDPLNFFRAHFQGRFSETGQAPEKLSLTITGDRDYSTLQGTGLSLTIAGNRQVVYIERLIQSELTIKGNVARVAIPNIYMEDCLVRFYGSVGSFINEQEQVQFRLGVNTEQEYAQLAKEHPHVNIFLYDAQMRIVKERKGKKVVLSQNIICSESTYLVSTEENYRQLENLLPAKNNTIILIDAQGNELRKRIKRRKKERK